MVIQKGYTPVVISGSPDDIIVPFANSIGIPDVFATTYEIDKGMFTGKVVQNCAVDETKRRVLKEFLQRNNVNLDMSIGFGDSHHDLAFLECVCYPVAVKPNKKLETIANERNWLVCKEDEMVLESVRTYLPS